MSSRWINYPEGQQRGGEGEESLIQWRIGPVHDKSPVASEGSYIRVLVLGTIEVSGVARYRTMP